MNIAGCSFPEHLWFHAEHQLWVELESPAIARVGITEMGIRQSGEIYMCRVKQAGTELAQGQSLAVVELAKSIVSVKSPVSGQLLDINTVLADQPECVHEDPYGAGWLARIQLSSWAADRTALVHGEAVETAMRNYAWLNRVEESTGGE
ncbi:glycine cleavage system H protein [beta proteobacterium AAP99]|nr:glycine cleavage system H protein [beta proteobacterium AAP99]